MINKLFRRSVIFIGTVLVLLFVFLGGSFLTFKALGYFNLDLNTRTLLGFLIFMPASVTISCFVLWNITKGYQKNFTQTHQKYKCVSNCQRRLLVIGNYNSRAKIWECIECGKPFTEDSVIGLEKNKKQTSDTLR